jgi:hypothetical protein
MIQAASIHPPTHPRFLSCWSGRHEIQSVRSQSVREREAKEEVEEEEEEKGVGLTK